MINYLNEEMAGHAIRWYVIWRIGWHAEATGGRTVTTGGARPEVRIGSSNRRKGIINRYEMNCLIVMIQCRRRDRQWRAMRNRVSSVDDEAQ